MKSQSQSADSINSVLRTLPFDSNRVKVINSLFIETIDHVNADSALAVAKEELLLSQKIKYKKGEAKAFAHLGIASTALGDSEGAINYYLKGLSIFEEINWKEGMASLYHNIGQIYIDKGQWSEATTYMNRAIQIDIANRDTLNIIYMFNKLGDLELKQGHYQLAIYQFKKAFLIKKTNKPTELSVPSFIGMGETYLKLRYYDSAKYYLQTALKLTEEYNVDKYTTIRIYHGFTQLLRESGELKSALSMAEKSFSIAQDARYKPEMATSLLQLTMVYEALEEYDKAFHSYKMYNSLHDSLTNVKVLHDMRNLTYRNELQRKEGEINLLRIAHGESILKRNMFILSLLGGLIVSFFLFNRRKLINKKELELKQQQLESGSRSLLEKIVLIEKIKTELAELKVEKPSEVQQIERFHKILHSNILTDEAWENFKKIFEEVHPLFFSTLRFRYPTLTVSELRLLSLIKLNLKLKEMTRILCITEEGVKKLRYRLKKKLELEDSLEEFVSKVK